MLKIFGKAKSYESIVAPLNKIESDLATYVGEQQVNISVLEDERKNIDMLIENSNSEITKSKFTVKKIGELLVGGE